MSNKREKKASWQSRLWDWLFVGYDSKAHRLFSALAISACFTSVHVGIDLYEKRQKIREQEEKNEYYNKLYKEELQKLEERNARVDREAAKSDGQSSQQERGTLDRHGYTYNDLYEDDDEADYDDGYAIHDDDDTWYRSEDDIDEYYEYDYHEP